MRVVVLVLPDVNLLDLGGPVQVFDVAAHLGADYRLTYVADAAQHASAQGLMLSGLEPLPATGPDDLILVPGPRLTSETSVSAAVVDWLRAGFVAGTRIAAVCSGAVALGEAGLLDGRRCTTHWELLEPMRARYPAARVQDAVLYVHDGLISTSAGISAGIDLALSLVERAHGPSLTAAVARQLVVYLRRDGSAGQVSPFLAYRDHLNSAVHRVQDHVAQHLADPLTLTDLAGVAHMSPRGLSRAFTATIGITPLRYQQQLRVELAQNLLSGTDLTVEAIAARCGFHDARHLRRLFAVRHGAPPSAHR